MNLVPVVHESDEDLVAYVVPAQVEVLAKYGWSVQSDDDATGAADHTGGSSVDLYKSEED